MHTATATATATATTTTTTTTTTMMMIVLLVLLLLLLSLFYKRMLLIVMSPLKRHIFVCFMAKSAFWGVFRP